MSFPAGSAVVRLNQRLSKVAVAVAGAGGAGLGDAVGVLRRDLRAEGVWRGLCAGEAGAGDDGEGSEAEGRV